MKIIDVPRGTLDSNQASCMLNMEGFDEIMREKLNGISLIQLK